MIEAGFLIGVFTVIFFLTWRYIWKRDVFFGTVYIFLFIYTIFAQIGYVYFPGLSIFIKAYFGAEIFYEVNLFVTLSFITFFLCFLFLYRFVIRKPAYDIIQSHPRYSILFYMVVMCHLFGMALYFIANYDVISYINASDEDFQSHMGIAYLLFGIGFKLSVAINLLLYFLFRVRVNNAPNINRYAVFFLLIPEMVLLAVLSVKLGNRVDVLALVIAVIVLEIVLARENRQSISSSRWRWTKILLVAGGALYGLMQIEAVRTSGQGMVDRSIAEMILYKDYFAPSHILIAAMALNYINPWEVIVSNSANALVLFKQPYLQTTVAELFNAGVSTRSASYAFYLFSEGYIAMGWFGFLYNGIMAFTGMAIWRRLANSSSSYYNIFMISLLATQAANIVRGQSSYFVKDIYMFFIPAMILLFLATGLRPWLGRKVHRKESLGNSETSITKH